MVCDVEKNKTANSFEEALRTVVILNIVVNEDLAKEMTFEQT